MPKLRILKQKKQWPRSRMATLVIGFASLGVIALVLTHAATPVSVIEPEDGVCSGNASKINDSSASGGLAIRFGQACQKDLFVSTTGNDSKDGASTANAVKTVAKAIQLANGPSRIRIMTGNYNEAFFIQKNDLTIEPYGNGDVTINGAIPEFIDGVIWTQESAGIYKYSLTRDESRAEGNPIYTSNGQQQWSYADLGQFNNRDTLDHLPGVFVFKNPFFNVSEVRVATDTGQAPTTPLYVGRAMATLDIINSNNISINGISGSKLKIAYGSTNIKIRTSNNIRINNVDIAGGMPGIAAFDSSNVTIKDNIVHGTFDRNWPYSDVKDKLGTHSMEHEGILVRADTKSISNIVVDGNDVSAYFDGIQFPVLSSTNGIYNIEDSEITNNVIHDFTADGIEADAPLKNVIIKGNTVYDANCPFSAAVATVGPVYVYENLFVANRSDRVDPSLAIYNGNDTLGPSYAIKTNQEENKATENMHFYYNTFYFAGNSGNIRITDHSTPTHISKDVSFINNIFYSYEGGIIRGTGRAADNVQWDGNVFFSEVNNNGLNPNYFKWNTFYDDNPNFDSYQSLSSIPANKFPSEWQGNVEGNPGFNCVTPTNPNCFRSTSSITKPSSLQPIPSGFAEHTRLNARTSIGRFE